MQESLSQLRKKENPAGEHPEEECIVREITKQIIRAPGTAPLLSLHGRINTKEEFLIERCV
jgi:hypothetical protein